ncbi:MAG: hypothetical protein KDA88_22385 [Planctomycetaceae bacterium]|nr:hypothetical protein [Planctomycetaceae bacterium]
MRFAFPLLLLAISSQLVWGGENEGEKPQALLLKRLLTTKVEANYRATPLQEAFAHICSEMKADLSIDGNAFKDAGWTKNMRQDFKLGEVTAERALAHIIKKYEEPGAQMVMSVDESKNLITITTRKFAERDKLQIYEFPKFDEAK